MIATCVARGARRRTIRTSRCSSSTTARPTARKPSRSRQREAIRGAGCSVTPSTAGRRSSSTSASDEARHELVAVTDADTHLHPEALKLLVARMARSPLVAAVAGAPHVTNRGRLILAMQVLEAAAIIGLIRRTQSLTGRVGVVAGVLGLFHRERVLAVGGYESRMATEDIDLTWKLLLDGWHTAYEPRALVGMQVPVTLTRAVGAAQALGPRPGGGAQRPPRREVSALAQPPHVARRPRVARVVDLDRRPDAVVRPRRSSRRSSAGSATTCSASASRGASRSPFSR